MHWTPPRRAVPYFPLEAPMVRLNRRDILTTQDLLNGVHIFGATGSGKTSGSGALIAEAFVRSGWGGLVLTAKPGDARAWIKRAKRCNRLHNILLVGPDHPARLNFLNYCMARPGAGAGLTANLISLFEEMLEVYGPNKSVGGDPYWRQGRNELLSNTIDLIWIAKGTLSFEDISRTIDTAPKNPSQIYDPAWRAQSFWAQLVERAADRLAEYGVPRDAHTLEVIYRFWAERFAPHDPEPRSSVISMVSALTDPLSRGILHELFLTGTNIVPEFATEGTIIILDMPVLEYEKVGRFAQVLFKGLFQRMAERRTHTDDTARPMFLWADEAHFTVTSRDASFLTVARESKVSTVFVSQSVHNYHVALGGDGGSHDQAKQLLGTFGLKIFHALNDPETARYAEELAGKSLQIRRSGSKTYTLSSSPGGSSSSRSVTFGWNEVLDFVTPARLYSLLRRGGPSRGYTEAILTRSGEPWKSTDSNVIQVTFPQRYA